MYTRSYNNISGTCFFSQLNIFRLTVIILAWWNLFTAPITHLWFEIYTMLVVEKGVIKILLWSILYDTLLILVYTLIRIYIIRILSIKRAGYLFLKKK